MASNSGFKFKKLLFSKPIIIVLILLIVFIGTLEFKQLRKRAKYNQEIAELQRQEQELVAKNKTLQDSLEYFNNEDYKEKIARQQLNLKKDGEIVVNFPATVPIAGEQDKPAAEPKNPEKWWNYFFNQSN
jgi:cell division protein FtsB